jgi:sirohydrochlorin cobaltochelatase
MSAALLFAVAGTSGDDAAGAFRRIDRAAEARFPGVLRGWAYTSPGVRRKLAARGAPVDDPAAALARLRRAGGTRAAVQSLHLVGGTEYTELRATVEAFNAGPEPFERVVVGRPMLEKPALFRGIVEALLGAVPARPEGPDALLLVAHGSRQAAAMRTYEEAAEFCRRFARPVLLGSLMGVPSLDDIVRNCRRAGLRSVFLVSFTVAAGTSVTGEVAGPDPKSWRSLLEREGIACVPILKGLGEYDGVVKLWLDEAAALLRDVG